MELPFRLLFSKSYPNKYFVFSFHFLTFLLMNTHVIKVGGENATDLHTAEWLATQSQNGERIAVAISALRTNPLNTTTELIHARDVFLES